MSQIMIAPGKYIQGAQELEKLGDYAKSFGSRVLVLISAGGLKRFGQRLKASFAKAEVTPEFVEFHGECSRSEIDRLLEIAREKRADVIVGLGGGKIFDTAKAVAHYAGVPVMIVPTIASTDAPCSALSVIYSDEGVFEEYLWLPSNPDMVIMDTRVIADSPLRLTVSGMGDALATWFEARACKASDADSCAGGKPTKASLALAKLCFETLMEDGRKARSALEAKANTKAVESIIEANTLLSGLGFESAGLAGAHAIHNGLTALPGTHSLYHGEKVAFGTLTQLMLEDAPESELNQVTDFCIDLGLPVTFEDLRIPGVTDEELMRAAELACAPNDTLHNLPFEVDAVMVAEAMKAADAYGRARKKAR